MFPKWHQTKSSTGFLPNSNQIHQKTDACSLAGILLLVSVICVGSDNDAVLHKHPHNNRPQAIQTDFLTNNISYFRWVLSANLLHNLCNATALTRSHQVTKIISQLRSHFSHNITVPATGHPQHHHEYLINHKFLLESGLSGQILSE